MATPKKSQTKRIDSSKINKKGNKVDLNKDIIMQKTERPKTSSKISSDNQGQSNILGSIQNIYTATPNETPKQTIQQNDFDEESEYIDNEVKEGNISSDIDPIINEDNFDFDSPVSEMDEIFKKFSMIYNEIYLEK